MADWSSLLTGNAQVGVVIDSPMTNAWRSCACATRGLRRAEIARRVQRDPATVSRELKRNEVDP